jgi:hypothetical protein
MNKKHIKTRIKNYLKGFLFAQLIVTLISLPILINWGLPISLMSLVGNFIFSPFITVFLILSSIIFFAECLKIPTLFLPNLLNKLTNVLDFILKQGSKNWLIGFQLPKNIFLLVLIPIIGGIIMTSKKITTLKIKTALLITFLFTAILLLKIPTSTNNIINIENKLEITKNPNKTITIKDQGYLNKKESVDSFIAFEVAPFLTKKFGNITIQELEIKKTRSRSLKAVIELNKLFKIKCVKINLNKAQLNRYGWKCFYALKSILKKEKIKFVVLN